jgi:hypothetical protein
MTLSLTTMAVTLEEADAYATARGRSAWLAAASGEAEALRRGQDYIAGRYNHLWVITFDNAAAPDAIKFAIIEAAIRELAVPGSMTPDLTLGREKVLTGLDALKWTPVKPDVGVDDLRPTLTVIDGLLFRLITRYRGPLVV